MPILFRNMSEASAQSKPNRKQCRRYNDPGHAHALTFSCFHRQPFLARDRTCQWFIEAIQQAREKHVFDFWAYVIMPEHVHLVILPLEDNYSISSILASIKRSVSARAIAYVRNNTPAFLSRMRDEQADGKCTYRFWQRGGGYDRNLWTPRYAWQTIDYVHKNPVRRGLCAAPRDWKWSSAATYKDETEGLVKIDFESLPDDTRRR